MRGYAKKVTQTLLTGVIIALIAGIIHLFLDEVLRLSWVGLAEPTYVFSHFIYLHVDFVLLAMTPMYSDNLPFTINWVHFSNSSQYQYFARGPTLI